MDVDDPCVFCEIIAGRAPAKYVATWPDAIAIIPRDPVADGHVLVIPRVHVADFTTDPEVTAATGRRAGELGKHSAPAMNLITSKGADATQSVFHLHMHLVPRNRDDGLALPWYSGKGHHR